MSERRCPRCGGLVAEDARWCGQCLARLDDAREDAPAPVAPASTPERSRPAAEPSGSVEVEEGRAVWTCPSCGSRNALDDDVCPRCGRSFASLFAEPDPPPRVAASRAAVLSLVVPGLGHVAAGRAAEGVARFVVFAYALGTALVVLLGKGVLASGPLVPLGWLALAGAVVVYLSAAVDAARVAERREPALSNRALLYGAIGLMMLTVIVLVVSGLRVTSARGAAVASW